MEIPHCLKRCSAVPFRAVFLLVICFSIGANAQTNLNPAVQVHIDVAKAAAYRPGNDLTVLYDTVCEPALSAKGPVAANVEGGPGENASRVPPRSEWYTPPVKVFDNAYWLGSLRQSTWAITTSDGIILIDSGFDYSVKDLVVDGLRKLNLDPAQIKYIILTHAHSDRFYGSRYLQDTYHPHVVMSAADWDTVEKSKDPANVKPHRDIVATDDMKLTLGDETITIYVTPGHTPGSISLLVPLKDGGQRHLGAVWGGINPDMGRMGVRYFPTLADTFTTWSASAFRFRQLAGNQNADVYLTLHPFYDKALDKLHALNFRGPRDPNPFVNWQNVNRFLTIIKECTDAQLARIQTDPKPSGE
jgi:metallo-beta-lactamase class B